MHLALSEKRSYAGLFFRQSFVEAFVELCTTFVLCHMSSASVSLLVTLSQPVLLAGILYHDMYASDLVGTHVEMRSLEVSKLCIVEATSAC